MILKVVRKNDNVSMYEGDKIHFSYENDLCLVDIEKDDGNTVSLHLVRDIPSQDGTGKYDYTLFVMNDQGKTIDRVWW